MSEHSSLRDHVMMLRRDAIHRGENLFFSPVPLFVILAHNMEGDKIFACIEYAVDDGYGSLEDLDRHDERQTSRLETAILEVADSINIRELLTIEYAGWPGDLQCSLCQMEYQGITILVTYQLHEVPAFQAIALGKQPEVFKELRDSPEVFLPRFLEENDRLVGVFVRQRLNLTAQDIIRLVWSMTGITATEDSIQGTDMFEKELQ